MNKLFIILTSIIIFLFVFKLTLFDPNIYNKDQKEIIDFLKGEKELNNKFSERETIHMNDVKRKINNFNLIFYLFLIIYSFSLYNIKEPIAKTLKIATLVPIAIFTLLSLFLLNFQSTFIIFHKILFQNNLWLLPSNSLLLQLFPQEFFYNFFKIVLIKAISLSTGLFVLILITKSFLRFNHH